jgi:hypothetical protein
MTDIRYRALYRLLQKSIAKYGLLENAIDSRMRIKTTTYSDVAQKPCQFYWQGLLHITIAEPVSRVSLGPSRKDYPKFGS